MIMKTLIAFIIYSLILFSCSAQNSVDNSDEFRYEGINNDPNIDPDFDKGGDKIKASIEENISHLNLFEYAHALPELYQLIDEKRVDIKDWKLHIDSLEKKAAIHMNDTVPAYWAVNHLGIIPLQAEFFIASLYKSERLRKKYPQVFKDLIQYTSTMKGLGYEESNYDSLITISDTKGENTFWYFFQLEGCNLKEIMSNKGFDLAEFISGAYLTSNYKVPFYLQKRKWYSLKRRMMESNSSYCQKCGRAMEKVNISIKDNDRDYFKDSLKEGVDADKIKEF